MAIGADIRLAMAPIRAFRRCNNTLRVNRGKTEKGPILRAKTYFYNIFSALLDCWSLSVASAQSKCSVFCLRRFYIDLMNDFP